MSVQFRIDHSPDSFSTRTALDTDDTQYYKQAVVVYTGLDTLQEEIEAHVVASRGFMLNGEFAAQDGTIMVTPKGTRIGGLAVAEGVGAWDSLLESYKINCAALKQAQEVLAAVKAPLWQVAGWAQNEIEVLEILDRTYARLEELDELGREINVVDVPEGTLL